MIHFIKILLVLISGYLGVKQELDNNNELAKYWFIVMLYWFLNLMQGLIFNLSLHFFYFYVIIIIWIEKINMEYTLFAHLW